MRRGSGHVAETGRESRYIGLLLRPKQRTVTAKRIGVLPLGGGRANGRRLHVLLLWVSILLGLLLLVVIMAPISHHFEEGTLTGTPTLIDGQSRATFRPDMQLGVARTRLTVEVSAGQLIGQVNAPPAPPAAAVVAGESVFRMEKRRREDAQRERVSGRQLPCWSATTGESQTWSRSASQRRISE